MNGFKHRIDGLIGKNKQLLIGLVMGALVMLPTGLYLNERSYNQQVETPITTQDEVKDTIPKETAPSPAEPSVDQAKPASAAPQQASPAPVSTSTCDIDAMIRADNKYDQALVISSQTASQIISDVTRQIDDPNTPLSEHPRLLAKQDQALTDQKERDRQIWNTHVTELAQVGCSRGQSYK